MDKNNIWSVYPCNEDFYLKAIFNFLMPEYIRLFGEDTMFAEQCIIYNVPYSSCPMVVFGTPLKIRLSQQKLSFWAQTIFQLSHELCHYALRKNKKNKEFVISWFEEIVCEAVSLYALEYSSANWNKCELYKCNSSFNESIFKYLNNEVIKVGTNRFSSCNTLEKLKEYEEKRISESDRESQINERNKVYKAISKNPNELVYLLSYLDYVSKDNYVTIDFDRWLQDCHCNLIEILKQIQPIKN